MKESSKFIIATIIGCISGLGTFFFSVRKFPNYSKGVNTRDVFKSPDAASNILGKITLQSYIELFQALIIAGMAMVGLCGSKLLLDKMYPTKATEENISSYKPVFSKIKGNCLAPAEDYAESAEWQNKVRTKPHLFEGKIK